MVFHKVLYWVLLFFSKSLGILSRLRHFVPTDTLLSVYRSLILPYRHNFMVLLYAWGQAAQKKLGKLHILQESSLRLIGDHLTALMITGHL